MSLGQGGKLELAEELARRAASVVQFYFACQRSGTRDVAATLHFLEYVRRLNQIGEQGSVGPPREPGQGYLF